MASLYPERQKEIFGLALELPPESREPFVGLECGDDRILFAAVMEMIRKYDELTDFLVPGAQLQRDTESATPTHPPAPEFHGNSRFQLTRQIGSGGFGTVFEALDRKKDAVVALKVLNRPDAAQLRMFKREFRTLAQIAHRNLVQLYELFDDGGHWFFTMELVRGTDFLSYVRGPQGGRHDQAIDYGRLRLALRQLVSAVCYLHDRRILHRDIKPPNVRVTSEGEVKLLDFGLVRNLSQELTCETKTVGGTAPYMAPELVTERIPNEAGDWYSLGVVLYEGLTGRPPFQGGILEVMLRKTQEPARPPRELAPDIPGDLNDLCVKLLERTPELRPNAAAVLASLGVPSDSVGLAAPLSATPPLVGRESHLAALHQAFEDVRAGDAICVHVQGQSGMGKSALCRSFLSQVRKQGAVVLSGRCYESESVPFKALDPIVDALGDHLKRLREIDVAAFLPREKPIQALSRVFPTLLQVEAIRRTHCPSLEETSPRDLQKRAIAALKEILARIAEKLPCVVHIDDLQWGDLDSVDCLASILAPPDPAPVLFVFSYRSEDVASCPHLQHLLAQQRDRDLCGGKIRELVVDRLTPSQSKQLVQELLGPEGDLLHQWIERETEGMPLFIHELALHARGGSPSTLVPSERLSLQQMIQRRIHLLPAPARRMVEIVSLAAQPIDVDVVWQAACLSGEERSARNALVAQNLIRFRRTDGGGQVEPFHDKIREAVVAGLSPDTKRDYFGALAAALAGALDGEMDARENADPEIVYQYFLAAGNLPQAETWLEIAAARAERALAFDLAVRLREKQLEMRAVEAPERSRLLERLAEALALAGRGLNAARTYQAAAQSATPDKNRELIRKAGEQYIRSGHFDEGQVLLRCLLERVGFRLPAYRWQALLWLLARRSLLRLRGLRFDSKIPAPASLGEVEKMAEKLDICRVTSLAMALQDPIRAAELQSRHLLHSLRLGEPYRIANSLAMEAGYLVARGGAATYPEANRLLDRIEELASRSNHPNGRTLALSVRSKVAWLAGRWEESARFGEEVHRMATEQYTRVAWEAYPSSIFWMCSLACMGRWREVIERLPGLEADSQARGDLLEMTSLPVLTFAYIRWLLSDQPEQAAAELEGTDARLREPGFVLHRFGICYGLTEVALYLDDIDGARKSIVKGWAQLETAMALRIQPVRILMLHLRARVACAAAAATQDKIRRGRILAEAMADARRIRKERTAWGNAVAGLIEAAVASEEHRVADGRLLLEASERDSVRAGMDQFAAMARYRKAHLSEGDVRRDAERQAAVWFDAQKVVKPERIVQLLCPGSWHCT